MHRSWLRAELVVVATLSLLGSACVDTRSLCEGIGVCDRAPGPPFTIDVVCDSSQGSTCTEESLVETLDVVLSAAARRPSSTVRLWAIGATVDGVVTLGNVTSPQTGPSERAREADEAAFVRAAKSRLAMAAETAFQRPARQSPIADTIARVLMASSSEGQRTLVILSDMREFGRYDFECGPLPAPQSFVKRLEVERVLGGDALKGVSVAFTYVGVPPVDGRRCVPTVQRARAIEAIWRNAVTWTGGTVVRYADGPVEPSDLSR